MTTMTAVGLLPARARVVPRPRAATAAVEETPDALLLARTAQGDAVAFRQLYQRHSAWLLVRLSRRCGDPAVVAAAPQDTFLAVWRSAGTWTASGEVGGWLWGIAVRRLVDVQRRRPREHEALADDGGPAVGSAEDEVLLDLRHGDLHRALQSLPTDLREVVQATVLDGLTTREAADLLGVPAGTVKTRMMRARRRLREELA